MKKNILIIEDDTDIVELLKLYLEGNNFNVYTASNGKVALQELKKNSIDLALLDIMMPEMNGYDFIKTVRGRKDNLPIIILSAKSMDVDKILGLNLGADVYLTKPFNPLEVIANINALLRRCEKSNSRDVFSFDEFVLNLEEYTLRKKGIVVPLTSTEIKMLAKLIKNPNRIFTKAQLYECIAGDVYENVDNTIMVHISNIRSKIEDDPSNPVYIKTIRGLGYKFEYEKK